MTMLYVSITYIYQHKYLTKLYLVRLDGKSGLWNFFCEPTAASKGAAEKLAHTKLIVSIQDCSSFESLKKL